MEGFRHEGLLTLTVSAGCAVRIADTVGLIYLPQQGCGDTSPDIRSFIGVLCRLVVYDTIVSCDQVGAIAAAWKVTDVPRPSPIRKLPLRSTPHV